ncbi:hypothetical protein [Burkholderia cepacia]|uniref:hypothetical protein n=1 Tax=Burkholderia cepacia TaxID=292 RepID=UPI002FE19C5F
MNTYAERLAWAMECARLSPNSDQSTLAKLVGPPCKPQNIQHLLDPNKNAKSSKYTPRIAAVLRCDPLWLAENVGKKPEPWPDREQPRSETFAEQNGSISGKVSDIGNNLGVNPSYPSVSEREKVSPRQMEEFIAELRDVWAEGRLTSRRFFLLRELLQEGTEILGDSIEKQQIATRGGHGPRASKRGKSGTG